MTDSKINNQTIVLGLSGENAMTADKQSPQHIESL